MTLLSLYFRGHNLSSTRRILLAHRTGSEHRELIQRCAFYEDVVRKRVAAD